MTDSSKQHQYTFAIAVAQNRKKSITQDLRIDTICSVGNAHLTILTDSSKQHQYTFAIAVAQNRKKSIRQDLRIDTICSVGNAHFTIYAVLKS